MDILLNGKAVDALSTIVHKSKARDLGKSYCFKLQSSIPRQLFEVVIQASVRGKVIAREVIKPIRKDVTAKCVCLYTSLWCCYFWRLGVHVTSMLVDS